MTISSFRGLALKKLPAELLKANGSILYSHPSTVSKGDLYILGLNPGGKIFSQSVRAHLNRPDEDWKNQYTEERWFDEKESDSKSSVAQRAKRPLQRNLIWLFEMLDIPLESVCASNLVFKRSQNGAGIPYLKEADACWPMHEAMLEIIQPKTLLVFGNSGVSPFDYLHRKMKPAPADWCTQPSGHGNWKCKAFSGTLQGRPTLVIGLPHLSRYSVVGKTEVVEWIRGLHVGTLVCQ